MKGKRFFFHNRFWVSLWSGAVLIAGFFVCGQAAWAAEETAAPAPETPVQIAYAQEPDPSTEPAPVGGGSASTTPSASPEAYESSRKRARPSTKGMEELVSLDLRATEAGDALKYLAQRGGLNISISKKVSGRVHLLLNDVPIRDVFDLILRTNELAYDRQGSVYNIMTEVEYRGLYGRKFSDLRQVRTFKLQYAVPAQAFNLLDTLKSEIGRLLIDEESGTVLIMDTPDRLREMEKALATMEQGGVVHIFDLKYATAADVEGHLKEQLELNKLGTVKADERSNQLVVRTFAQRMREVERLVAALDRKTREVLIDSKIVKVSMSDDLDSGIDWNNVFTNIRFQGVDKVGDFRTAVEGTAPSEVPATTRFNLPTEFLGQKVNLGQALFQTVARDGYELFRFLETVGETKLISNPRILVTEGQEARIHVGTREAYVTTTTTTGQTTTTTAEEIEFIDVGIQLTVTPIFINEDGFITMSIKPDISSVVRTLTTPSDNEIPIVDTSTAETKVLVKDGRTVIIGGLRSQTKQFSTEQVPIMGKIPLLGELFKQRDKDDSTAELVVFISPHIVSGDELVTGDEGKFGPGVKPGFRGYKGVLGETPAAIDKLPAPSLPLGVRGMTRPVTFRLRERVRDFAEAK